MDINIYKKCIFCRKVVDWITKERVFANGTIHIEGTCSLCGYTKFLPKEKELHEHIFHFGKYKGKNITEVPYDYLQWCIEKDVVGGGMAFAIIEYLKEKNIIVNNYRNKTL